MRLSNGYPMKRKTGDGSTNQWTREEAVARVPMLMTSYIQREKQLAATVSDIIEAADGKDQDQS